MIVSVTDGFDKNNYIDLYYVLLANKKEDGTDILVDVDFAKFTIYKGVEYHKGLEQEQKRVFNELKEEVENADKNSSIASNIPSIDYIYTVYVYGEYHVCVKEEYGNVTVYKKIDVASKHVDDLPFLTVTEVFLLYNILYIWKD